jgi:hypothetical protein
MANFAVLNGDTVSNVISAETVEDAQIATNAECVECDGSFWIGWTRKGKKWIAPVEQTLAE